MSSIQDTPPTPPILETKSQTRLRVEVALMHLANSERALELGMAKEEVIHSLQLAIRELTAVISILI
jgi:hypothetical protein